MRPMRSALIPPDAEDADPQIVIAKMMTNRAPEPIANSICPACSVENPRLNAPESNSKSPRLTIPPIVVKYDPISANAMIRASPVTQTTIVLISISLKKRL